MVILLLALHAHSAEPRLARWEVVEAPSVVEPDGELGRWVSWGDGSVIGLRCEAEPEVVGLSKGARIRGGFVSPASEVGVWQIVPDRAVRWSGFVVRDPDCRVERLRTSATPWAWALAEARGDIATSRPRLAGAAAAAWAGEDPLRQAALRPPGPHPAGARQLVRRAPKVSLDGRVWSRVEADSDWTIEGPARVRVDMRALGDQPESCFLLDGELRCQDSEPGRTAALAAGVLAYGPRVLEDGTPVHPLRSWTLAVGAGEHRLRTDRDALLRAVVHPIETYRGASPTAEDLAAAEGVAVWTPPPKAEWATVPFAAVDSDGEGRWLVRVNPTSVQSGTTWQALGARHPEARLAEPEVVELWLESDAPSSLCTVSIEGRAFTALAPHGIHRFGWIGPSALAEPRVQAEGCRAWLRSDGPAESGSLSLSYLHVLQPGDEAQVQVDVSRPARVEVALPAEGGPVEILAIADDRREVRFRVQAPTTAIGRVDVDGASYTESVYLPLPLATGWRIQTDAPVVARIGQRLPEGGLPEPEGPKTAFPLGVVGEARFDGPDPEAFRVRSLTAQLPEAASDAERAEILVERGGLLAARDAWALASRDLLRAEELQPGLRAFDDPVGKGLRLARERALYGADVWRPRDRIWVEAAPDEEVEAIRPRAEAAAAGDFIAVAERTEGPEAARWWRRAILGGQVLTAEQRLEAFLVANALPEHPDLQILRSGTRWDGVNLIRGAARRMRVRWPVPRDDNDDLLYPDAWEPERIVPLRRGWLLRLPARAQGQALHLRCLVRALSTTGPCRIMAEDSRGETVVSALISGWGTPDVLWLPPGGELYLRLDEPFGAHAQLLWTVPGEVPGIERLAWESSDRLLETTILGPTAVRVHVRPQSPGPTRVRVWAGGAEVTRTVEGESEVILPVTAEGAQTVRIAIDRRSWVRVATRRAKRGGPIAAGDRRAVTLAQPTVEPEGGPPAQALPRGPGPMSGMPAGVPARTWRAALTVGSAEWTPAEARGPVGAPPAVMLDGGLQARVSDDLWTEADLGVQTRFDGAVIGLAHAGADLRLSRGRTRVFGIGDLNLAAGPFAGRRLGSARLDLGTRIVHPVWYGGTLQGRIELRGRARTTFDPADSMEPNKARLWSRYAEDHRVQLALAGSLRHRFNPWVVGRGGLYATSNWVNDPLPIDLVGAQGSVDLSREGLFTRFGTGLELRFFDDHRKDAFLSWMLETRVRWFPWLGVRTGLHPWAGARWRPTDRKASVMAGIEGRFGAPRGLVDVRPSRLASRHVGEWFFWEHAHARWPAGVGDEGLGDGPAPVLDNVEVEP